MNSFEKQRIILRELRSMPKLKQGQRQARQIREVLMKQNQEKDGENRLKKTIRLKTVLTGATASVVAIVLSGTLIYNLVLSPGNLDGVTNKASRGPNSTTVIDAKELYTKTLGFVPMLPSYIPANLRLANTSLDVGTGMSNPGKVFYMRLAPQNSRASKLTMFETTSSQFNDEIKKNLNLKLLPPQNQGTQGSGDNSAGASIVAYRRTGSSEQFVYVLKKNDIAYGLETSGTVSRSEITKILTSCTLLETEKPQTTQIYSKKSVSDIQVAVPFQIIVPRYIPDHFKLTGYMRGEGALDSNGRSFHADFGYQYDNALISVDEQFSDAKGSNVLDNDIPAQSQTENLNGHKVYFHTSSRQGTISETYQWYGDNGVLFTVTASHPTGKSVMDRTSVQRVVESMFTVP